MVTKGNGDIYTRLIIASGGTAGTSSVTEPDVEPLKISLAIIYFP